MGIMAIMAIFIFLSRPQGVIPAKAGIQCLLFANRQRLTANGYKIHWLLWELWLLFTSYKRN